MVQKSLRKASNFGIISIEVKNMAKITWKGGTLLAPVPAVMVTCKDGDKQNVFTVAWTGIINSDPPKTYISVRKERFSHPMILNSGYFAINLVSRKLVEACDYCGIVSGKKVDKFEACRLETESAEIADVPVLKDSPLALICKVTDVVELGTHDMFIADILGERIEEELIDESGKLHLDHARLVAYSHGEYFELGQKLGKFGYSIARRREREELQKRREQNPKPPRKERKPRKKK